MALVVIKSHLKRVWLIFVATTNFISQFYYLFSPQQTYIQKHVTTSVKKTSLFWFTQPVHLLSLLCWLSHDVHSCSASCFMQRAILYIFAWPWQEPHEPALALRPALDTMPCSSRAINCAIHVRCQACLRREARSVLCWNHLPCNWGLVQGGAVAQRNLHVHHRPLPILSQGWTQLEGNSNRFYVSKIHTFVYLFCVCPCFHVLWLTVLVGFPT